VGEEQNEDAKSEKERGNAFLGGCVRGHDGHEKKKEKLTRHLFLGKEKKTRKRSVIWGEIVWTGYFFTSRRNANRIR